MFMSGVQVTLIYAIIGTVAGFIIGLILGGIRALEINDSDSAAVKVLKRIGRLFTSLYIWVFRGTPMMVQAMFLYYGLQPIIGWDGPTAGLFVISINTGAYMAEIIRSGLQSVDSGQSEAAKSLGMSTLQTMVHIILGDPQRLPIHRQPADRQHQGQLDAERDLGAGPVLPEPVLGRKQLSPGGDVFRGDRALSDPDDHRDALAQLCREAHEHEI